MAISLTISSADGDRVVQISVEPQQSVGSVALPLQEQFGIPVASQVLLHDGNPVRLDLSFEAAGIKPDDLLVIMANPAAARAPAPARAGAPGGFTLPTLAPQTARAGMRISDIPPNASPELLLDIAEKNPQLLPEIKQGNPKLGQALEAKSLSDVRMVLLEMHMAAASRNFEEQEEMMALERNPFDAAAQAKIEERIRLSNVQKNMEIAIEEMPEAFARVYMLYIPCEVNGTPVKAFVDSGAQSTIMSSSCAERCGIMRLVDKRFEGQAVGVGTAKIIGRVHMAPLKIGNFFYNCSFTILDQQGVDFLFGLDMLKRHQCCIDLQKNVLRLQDASGGHEVPFLPENEIPTSERSDPTAGPTPQVPATPPPPAPAAAAAAAAASPAAMTTASAPSAPSTPAPGGVESESDKIQRLVALGFDPQRAAAALASTNGNVELAAGLLFETMG